MDKHSLNSNEVVALEVKKGVQLLGLTLEGLFRHCDNEEKGFIKTTKFLEFLIKIKHGVSRKTIEKSFILLLLIQKGSFFFQMKTKQVLSSNKIF